MKSTDKSHHNKLPRVSGESFLLDLRLQPQAKLTPYELAEMIREADEMNAAAKKRLMEEEAALQSLRDARTRIRAIITALSDLRSDIENPQWLNAYQFTDDDGGSNE